MAAEQRAAGRGRCGHTGAPHPGGSAAAGREKEREGCKGPRSDLHCPVQPAGGSTSVCFWPNKRKMQLKYNLLYNICFILQIVKILTLYTPHGDLDERVTLNFIRTVQVMSQSCMFLII